MKPSKPLLPLLLGLLLLGVAEGALALASDRQQSIYIESDRAERNENNGVTVYQGKVKMEQGTLRIDADKITIHSVDNRISKIVAIGQPARYQQRPSPERELVIAEGGTIKYLIRPERLELIKNASIQQEGTTLSGERIDYDIAKALVKAGGDPNSSQPRIQMIIPPTEPETTPEPLTPSTGTRTSDTLTPDLAALPEATP